MERPLRAPDAAADLVAAYARHSRPERFDEAVDAKGALKPHWRMLVDWLGREGPEGYGRAAVENERLRAESGIAFDASREAQPPEHTDALPVMIDAAEWARISEAVCQRARLLEAVIADIHGPARTPREGVMPAELVYASPAFAPHCAGWETPPRPWLHLYEADLARGADGRWMILADRVNAPLGDGWAIANRVAASQAFAEPFVEAGVRRLAGHYAEFQRMLEESAGPQGRIALLTGGESDPRYFSHAYFARYLNVALVEPRDVTVREGAAHVKTIDGLKTLDLMLRGVLDWQLDALFRPADAATGAPGLSMAARSGRLVVANALGAGVMGYRALAPFAHRLCEHLLGEKLAMNDGPCLWLGDPEARKQVLDEPEFWRVEHLASGPHPEAPRLTGEGVDRDVLARRLAREGARFAAVATPPLSTVPVWRAGGLMPRQWMLRVFCCLNPSGWRAAPGGVASVVEPGRAPPPLGFGKDVWVLPRSGERADAPSGSVPSVLTFRRRTSRELLSRVADDIFWVSRTAERVETTLRVMRACVTRLLAGIGIDGEPHVLAAIIEIQAGANPALEGHARVRDAIGRLAGAADEPLGMRPLLGALRHAGLNAQPYLSEDGWRCIDRLTTDARWKSPPDTRLASALLRMIDDALMILSSLSGTGHENQTRNHVWRFLELGRRIERAVGITRIGEALAGLEQPAEETLLRAWHTIGDSRNAYRTRYMTLAAALPTIDLLVLDETNPRSLAFQLVELEAALAALPNSGTYRRPEHRRAMKLLMDVRLAEVEELARPDAEGRRAGLMALLGAVRGELFEIADILARAFFAHADRPAAIVGTARRRP